MSRAVYKSNPTFIYNYRRDGYIPPFIKSFDARSSRVFQVRIMDLFPPFRVEGYVIVRFFRYHLYFPDGLVWFIFKFKYPLLALIFIFFRDVFYPLLS